MDATFADVEVRQSDDGPAVNTLVKVRVRNILGTSMVNYEGKAHTVFYRGTLLYIIVG